MLRFAAWAVDRLPIAAGLTSRALERIDAIRGAGSLHDAADVCARAVGTLTRLEPTSHGCGLSLDDQRRLLDWFGAHDSGAGVDGPFELQACARVADILWRGRQPQVQSVLSHAPGPDELVVVTSLPGGAAALRARCAARSGNPDTFPVGLRSAVQVAVAAGEDVRNPPWAAEPRTELPLEAERLADAMTLSGWGRHLFGGQGRACAALGLPAAACRTCGGAGPHESYDCQILDLLVSGWRRRTLRVTAATASACALLVLWGWARAFRRASRAYGGWRAQVRGSLRGMGLRVERDWIR